MPSAHAVLWFLGTFILLWAASLVVRGLVGSRRAGPPRCPSCNAAIADPAALRCAGCGFEARTVAEMRGRCRHWGMAAAGAALAPVGAAVLFAGQAVWSWTHATYGPDVPALTIWHCAAAATAVFGLIIIGWALRGDPSRGRARCPRCWYDMTGGGLRCPECGHDARHRRQLYRPRRRWKVAGLASLILLVATGLVGVPRVQRGGWRAMFPTTGLVAALPWLPPSLAYDPGTTSVENWTLEGRFESQRMWGWQKRWMRSRARSVLEGSPSPCQVRAALPLADLSARSPLQSKAMLAVARGLTSPDRDSRTAAALCLYSLTGIDADTRRPPLREVEAMLPDLEAVVADPSQPADVTIAAAYAISQAGPAAERAIPTVLQAAGRGGRLRSFMLVGPLWAIMRQAPGARAKLLDAAEGSDPAVAAAAIETLRYAGATSDEIRDRLLAIAQRGDDARALLAARALAHGRAEPAQVIPVILDQVQGQRQNRAAFLDTLALYDEELLPYLPQLFDLFTDTDPGVRSAAIRLTAELHQRINIPLATSRAWPAIAALRNDPDPKVAAAALEAVGEGEASMPDR